MALVLTVLVVIVVFYAIWPPYRAPDWWRDLTRPLRRLVRPHYYR